MKKFLSIFLMLFVFAITVPSVVDAQTCGCRRVRRSYASRNYNTRYYRTRNYTTRYYRARNYNTRYYNTGRYYPQYSRYTTYRSYGTQGYTYYRRPNFYHRHRNAINIGIGTGAGAIIGGIIGGRRGAVAGALLGAGGGAVYSYGIRPKKRRYYR